MQKRPLLSMKSVLAFLQHFIYSSMPHPASAIPLFSFPLHASSMLPVLSLEALHDILQIVAKYLTLWQTNPLDRDSKPVLVLLLSRLLTIYVLSLEADRKKHQEESRECMRSYLPGWMKGDREKVCTIFHVLVRRKKK